MARNVRGRSTPARTLDETILREFPSINGNRVRLIQTAGGAPRLDIREYVADSESGFHGFTRRGIRLDAAGMEALLSVLLQIRDGAQEPGGLQEGADLGEFWNDKPEEDQDEPADAVPAAAPERVAQVIDRPPVMPPPTLDEILQATQARRDLFGALMPEQKHQQAAKPAPAVPAIVQAPKATPTAPPKGLKLSQLAALL